MWTFFYIFWKKCWPLAILCTRNHFFLITELRLVHFWQAQLSHSTEYQSLFTHVQNKVVVLSQEILISTQFTVSRIYEKHSWDLFICLSTISALLIDFELYFFSDNIEAMLLLYAGEWARSVNYKSWLEYCLMEFLSGMRYHVMQFE